MIIFVKRKEWKSAKKSLNTLNDEFGSINRRIGNVEEKIDNIEECLVHMKKRGVARETNQEWMMRILWIFIPALLGINVTVLLKLFGVL